MFQHIDLLTTLVTILSLLIVLFFVLLKWDLFGKRKCQKSLNVKLNPKNHANNNSSRTFCANYETKDLLNNNHSAQTKSILTNAQPLVAKHQTNNHHQDSNSNDDSSTTTATTNGQKSPTAKQVHFADVISISTNDPNHSKNTNNKHNKQANNNKIGFKQKQLKQVINLNHDNEAALFQEATTNHVNDVIAINNNEISDTSIDHQYQRDVPTSKGNALNQIKSFNQQQAANSKQKQVAKKGRQQQQQQQQQQQRKRHNSDRTNSNSTYSSERLFSLLAASCLSKDEIELAVETLLNKLETGESNWQRPKSDPLQRLKNQLRDSEAALAAETQNHEQTRARLVEIKTQLLNERSTKNVINEDFNRLRNELTSANVALEKTSNDLSKQRQLYDNFRDESSNVIARLEQDNARLKSHYSDASPRDEIRHLRHELKEKTTQLQRYELSNQSLSKKNHGLEAGLRAAEIQMENYRSKHQQENYETCARISELESERMALEKALEEHMSRFKEISATNSLLEKSLKELRSINSDQEEMLNRMHDDRHVKEAAMKRTLCEMECELRKLHARLSARTIGGEEINHRPEINHIDKESTTAPGHCDQKSDVKRQPLNEELAKLFPGLRTNEMNNQHDWDFPVIV